MTQSFTFKSLTASLLSGIIWLVGGWDVLVQALLVAMTLDFLGGVLHAYADGRLNSTKMRRGILRKSAYFAVIVLAVMLDRTLFASQPVARTLSISYLLVNESLSILEHAAALGVPIPKQLVEKLERLNGAPVEQEQPDQAQQ